MNRDRLFDIRAKHYIFVTNDAWVCVDKYGGEVIQVKRTELNFLTLNNHVDRIYISTKINDFTFGQT